MDPSQGIINVSIQYTLNPSSFAPAISYTVELATIIIANPNLSVFLKPIMKTYFMLKEREGKKEEEQAMMAYFDFCVEVHNTIASYNTMAKVMKSEELDAWIV
jgi:hypothetical protein